MTVLTATVSPDLSWTSGCRLRLESRGRAKDVSGMINFVSSGRQDSVILNGWSHETWLFVRAMVPFPPQARSMMMGFPPGHLTLEAPVCIMNCTTLDLRHFSKNVSTFLGIWQEDRVRKVHGSTSTNLCPISD